MIPCHIINNLFNIFFHSNTQRQINTRMPVVLNSDGFTHRSSRPWPTAPRSSFPWRLNINYKFAKLRRGITSQFTLKRVEMLMSTLNSYQYSKNTTILCIWAWDRCRPSVWIESGSKKGMEKKMFNSPLTKSSQQRKTTRHCKTPMKSNIVSIGSYVWLFLLDFLQTEIATILYVS